jgi:hypothetical protein
MKAENIIDNYLYFLSKNEFFTTYFQEINRKVKKGQK